MRKGTTFVTSGPMLMFTVNDVLPGDTLKVAKSQKLRITLGALGHREAVPLSRIELIKHGKVIASKSATNINQKDSLSLLVELKADEGCWLAARCFAGEGQVAHTTPVYVYVDGKGFYDASTIQANISLAEKYLSELEGEIKVVRQDPERQSWRYRKPLEDRIVKARAVLAKLKQRVSEK